MCSRVEAFWRRKGRRDVSCVCRVSQPGGLRKGWPPRGGWLGIEGAPNSRGPLHCMSSSVPVPAQFLEAGGASRTSWFKVVVLYMRALKCKGTWQFALIPRAFGQRTGVQGPACLLDTAASRLPWGGEGHTKGQSLGQATVVFSVAQFGLGLLAVPQAPVSSAVAILRGSCSPLLGCWPQLSLSRR